MTQMANINWHHLWHHPIYFDQTLTFIFTKLSNVQPVWEIGEIDTSNKKNSVSSFSTFMALQQNNTDNNEIWGMMSELKDNDTDE